MSFVGTLVSGAKILGGLSGLFGKKKKAPSPRDNIMSQAQGARDAAEAYGFNPLTLLQYGQPGGSMAAGGGTPPLASIDLLTEGLSAFDPEAKAERERQRQADQLNLDLARIKLEQARSGVVLAPPVAPGSLLGKTAVGVMPSGAVRVGNAPYSAVPVRGSASAQAASGGGDDSNLSVTQTYEIYENDGQRTNVPRGPDVGEVVMGGLIAAHNRDKSFRAHHTTGAMLREPRFGKQAFYDDLMPPKIPLARDDLTKTQLGYLSKNGRVFYRGRWYSAGEISQ